MNENPSATIALDQLRYSVQQLKLIGVVEHSYPLSGPLFLLEAEGEVYALPVDVLRPFAGVFNRPIND